MRSILIVLLTVSLFVFGGSIDDDYDDLSIDQDNHRIDKYPVLAERLNCSGFVVRHKGVKTEEIITKSIYKSPPTPVIQLTDDISHPLKTVYVEDAENDNAENKRKSAENYSTEKTIKLDDTNEKKKWKRATTVMIERLWTAENISIIDGYSKVAIYPIRERYSAKRETMPEKIITRNVSSECTDAPFNDDGDEFNWYQIIVNNGGQPGEVNATRLTPNVTEVLEPCHRPVTKTSPPLEDLLYEYELIEYEKVYRHEKAFLRFAGTPSEFVDIVGQLVWAPLESERRYYRVSYRKDDTGFYVNVRRRHKCEFAKNPLTVNCRRVDDLIYDYCDIVLDGGPYTPTRERYQWVYKRV